MMLDITRSPRLSWLPQALFFRQKSVFPENIYVFSGKHPLSTTNPIYHQPHLRFPELDYKITAALQLMGSSAEEIPSIFERDGYSEVEEKSIAIHWYGGSPVTQKVNNAMTRENYKSFNSTISKAIEKVLEE